MHKAGYLRVSAALQRDRFVAVPAKSVVSTGAVCYPTCGMRFALLSWVEIFRSASWCAFFCGATLAAVPDWSALPEDVPVTAEVVHHRLHSFRAKHHFEAGAGNFYGDRFLDALSFSLSDTYGISETFSLSAGVTLVSSRLSSEFEAFQAVGVIPTVYNPILILFGSAQYNPIYGKFALGSSIYRFRAGLEAGVFVAQNSFHGGVYNSHVNSPGVKTGVNLVFPFSNGLVLSIKAATFLHPRLDPSEPGLFRVLTALGASVGVVL